MGEFELHGDSGRIANTGIELRPDAFIRNRFSGPPENEIARTGGSQSERTELRLQAQEMLGTIIGALEAGRDQMRSLHADVKAGNGPSSLPWQTHFRQSEGAYSQAVEKATGMLYDRESDGRLKPNAFYRATEKERELLEKDMAALKTSNPAEYKRLSQQHAMLSDVLRAKGYAHANFGLALLRSSVYLPKDARDAQALRGNEMLMVAATYDPSMIGDPNFVQHHSAIMKVVDSTPYVKGQSPAAAPGREAIANPPATLSNPVSPEITQPPPTDPVTPRVETPAPVNHPAEVKANPEVVRPIEATEVTPEMLAKVAPLLELEKAFRASALAYREVEALHDFAAEVKLLRDFEAKVRSLRATNEATPERVQAAQASVFSGSKELQDRWGPGARPDLINETGAAIQEIQRRVMSRAPLLFEKYNHMARPNLADEIQLDATSLNLKVYPGYPARVFALANEILKNYPPEKVREMGETQRTIHQIQADKLMPRAEQQQLGNELNQKRAAYDTAMAMLSDDAQSNVNTKYQEWTEFKEQTGSRYRQSMPQFQSDLQSVRDATQPDSEARMTLIAGLRAKYLPQIEANSAYRKELQTAYEQIFGPLKSVNPNVETVLNCQKALEDFIGGVNGQPNQTLVDKASRQEKIAAMVRPLKAKSDLDDLLHTAAVVQGYEARALFFSPSATDHERSVELMAASSKDEGAAPYLTMAANAVAAAKSLGSVQYNLDQSNAPIEMFSAVFPGSGGFVARRLATWSDGLILGRRLENDALVRLGLAEGFASEPVHTQAKIDSIVAEGKTAGNGLLRDVSSMGAYALTLKLLSKTKLPGPLGIVSAALSAGATSDFMEDYKLDGPINNPGAWGRGAGLGLGGHLTYNTLLGKWSHTALAQTARARATALGAEAKLPRTSRLWSALKEYPSAYLNPRNMNPLGSNALISQASIGTADAARLLTMQRNIGAMKFYRNIETAFVIGAGGEGLKIIDGQHQVNSAGDALSRMNSSGLDNAVVSALLVPASAMGGKWLFSPFNWLIKQSTGVNVAALFSTPGATSLYAFGRGYLSDFSSAGTELGKVWDLERAQGHVVDPDKLSQTVRQLNPRMTEAQAKARAMMYIQDRRGHELRRAQAAGQPRYTARGDDFSF
jgi:hypothetical protein